MTSIIYIKDPKEKKCEAKKMNPIDELIKDMKETGDVNKIYNYTPTEEEIIKMCGDQE